MRTLAFVLPLLADLPAWSSLNDEVPSAKEQKALVEEYFATDWKTSSGMQRHDEILSTLSAVPALDDRAMKTWTKALDKIWKKGPKLEKKSGRHYLWEKEKRGLYIIGGKSGKPSGLFLGMHGGGAGSGDAGSSAGAWGGSAGKEKWVAIFPQVLEKTEHGWTDSGTEEFVIELLERARRTWKLDADRTFFGGHSMGGYGTWTLGSRHADMVAALTPSAGAPTPVLDGPGGKIVDVVPGIVPNLRNVPIVIYQSDDDPRVPPEVNRTAAKRLGEAKERWGGFDYEYWEVEGRGHDLPPGGTAAHLEKVHDHVRNPYPERIVWQPTLSWKRQFYWLWWKNPELEAIVQADLDRDNNTIDIETKADVSGMYVLLSDAVVDMSREVVVRVNGEETNRAVPTRTLDALVSTARYGDPGRTYPARLAVRP